MTVFLINPTATLHVLSCYSLGLSVVGFCTYCLFVVNFNKLYLSREAYLASENAGGGDTPSNAPAAPETAVPDELICSLCRDLLTDAVMIPCCGNSFCDECKYK